MKKLLVPLMLLSMLLTTAVLGGCGSDNSNALLNNDNILTTIKSGGNFKLESDITVNAEQFKKSLSEAHVAVNIDLDGNKLAFTSKVLELSNTKLKITNGELICANSNSAGAGISVSTGAEISIENVRITAPGTALEVCSDATSVIIDGCAVNAGGKQSITTVEAEGESTLLFDIKNTVIEQNPQSNSSTAIALYAGTTILDNVTISGAWFGLNVFDAANVTVKDCEFTCTHACILSAWVQDSTFTGSYNANSKVIVESGTYAIDGSGTGTAYMFAPIHWAGMGTLDINGGTFENKNTATGAGVYVRNGTVNIHDAVVSAQTALKITAEQKDTVRATLNVFGGKFKASGAATYLFTNVVGNSAERLEVNISGGSFSGSSCIAVNLNDVNEQFTYGVSVEGGTFDKSVLSWLGNGVIQTENADGTFTVKGN